MSLRTTAKRRIKDWVVRLFSTPARDLQLAMIRRAADSTAAYIETHMPATATVLDTLAHLRQALQTVTVEGLYLEFGVWKGRTLRAIARAATDHPVYGFDSFAGLPEDWWRFGKGNFALKQLPQMPPNVTLVKGWFNETLPGFLSQHPEPVAFIHIDCDLYSSTKTVLDLLAPRLCPGTVIVFDEYFNYTGWKEHEFRAFQEFIAESGCTYRYLSYVRWGAEVAVRIESVPHRD